MTTIKRLKLQAYQDMDKINAAVQAIVETDRPSTAPKGIPLETVLELRNKNLTLEQIGKILGCTKQTVGQRLKRHQPTFDRIEQFKKHRADILTLKQAEIIQSLTPADIQKAPPQVKSMMFGIFYDKERLERGQSTGNVSVKSTVEHYATRLDEINKALESIED